MIGQPLKWHQRRAMNLIHGSATPPCCLRIVLEMWLPGTSPGMTWNDLHAPNKTYDNPSAFNASCTFGRAFAGAFRGFFWAARPLIAKL
jgi:hypothetical protein